MGYYDLLDGFARQQGLHVSEAMQWLAKYDLLLHEKPRKTPGWITVDLSRQYHNQIQAFYQNNDNIATYLPEYAGEPSTRIERLAHLEIFPFAPESGAAGKVAVVFNYKKQDITGRAQVHTLSVESL